MSFFLFGKNKVSLSGFLDFSVFGEYKNFKMCDVRDHKRYCILRGYTFHCFFLILGRIKMKFGQLIV